jgi:hypothetical protein
MPGSSFSTPTLRHQANVRAASRHRFFDNLFVKVGIACKMRLAMTTRSAAAVREKSRRLAAS